MESQTTTPALQTEQESQISQPQRSNASASYTTVPAGPFPTTRRAPNGFARITQKVLKRRSGERTTLAGIGTSMLHQVAATESPGAWLKFIVFRPPDYRQADWNGGRRDERHCPRPMSALAQSVTQLVQRRITMAPECYSHLWTARIPKSSQS